MIRLLSVFSVLCVVLLGCSNLVSSPEDKLPPDVVLSDEILITLEFKNNLNFTNFDYYLVFSSSSNITVRDINLPDIFYFLPGDTVNISSIQGQNELFDEFQDYFGTFFSTWRDFIRISKSGNNVDLGLMNGPFSPTVNSAEENQVFEGNLDNNFSPSQISVDTQKITIQFPVDSLSIDAGQTQVFFNFITVDKVNSVSRRLAFFLEDNEDNKIVLSVGEAEKVEPNQLNTDIESWEVQILQL